MRITLCQTNPTPGSLVFNTQMILDGIREANRLESDLVVFPELAITGYLSKDLFYTNNYVLNNLKELNKIVLFCNQVGYKGTVVLGYVDFNYKNVGKPFRNMAAVIQNGILITSYQKQLLPFYDVFDEGRYFEPGNETCVITINEEKFGICICEDLWNDKDAGENTWKKTKDYFYENNPLKKYRELGIRNIISINSSPYVKNKPKFRREMLVDISKNNIDLLIYCNQIGGQDELYFDGNSIVLNRGKEIGSENDRHQVDIFSFTYNGTRYPENYYETNEAKEKLSQYQAYLHESSMREEELHKAITGCLYDYVKKSNFNKVVVASSGGIDSAVVISLACDVFGPKNVFAIRMPSKISSQHSIKDAKELHDNWGCNDILINIDHDSVVKNIHSQFPDFDSYNLVANENIQSRIRGNILMYFSNAFGWFPLTTGNKTELALGYCTLYGDCNGGFAPISDLLKREVYELAGCYKKYIPENIFKKTPSAELSEGQTDEGSLKVPYFVLDKIVQLYIEKHICDFNIFVKTEGTGRVKDWSKLIDSEKDYQRIISLIDRNEFKRRQYAPGVKVSQISFGIGRRMPIVKM